MSALNIFQLNKTASFANDLGLDSLDAVEVVMAVEEVCVASSFILCYAHCPFQEFAIEIPDAEADEITTVQQGMSLVTFFPSHVLTSLSN